MNTDDNSPKVQLHLTVPLMAQIVADNSEAQVVISKQATDAIFKKLEHTRFIKRLQEQTDQAINTVRQQAQQQVYDEIGIKKLYGYYDKISVDKNSVYFAKAKEKIKGQIDEMLSKDEIKAMVLEKVDQTLLTIKDDLKKDIEAGLSIRIKELIREHFR